MKGLPILTELLWCSEHPMDLCSAPPTFLVHTLTIRIPAWPPSLATSGVNHLPQRQNEDDPIWCLSPFTLTLTHICSYPFLPSNTWCISWQSKSHLDPYYFFGSICLFGRRSYKVGDIEIYFPSAASHPKWQQQPKLGQVEVKSQEFQLGLPCRYKSPNTKAIFWCIPRWLNWKGSGYTNQHPYGLPLLWAAD